MESIKKDKITLNLEENTVAMVDELAEISKTNREMMICALIGKGIKELVEDMSKSWEKIAAEKNDAKAKSLVAKIKAFEKKWDIQKFP